MDYPEGSGKEGSRQPPPQQYQQQTSYSTDQGQAIVHSSQQRGHYGQQRPSAHEMSLHQQQQFNDPALSGSFPQANPYSQPQAMAMGMEAEYLMQQRQYLQQQQQAYGGAYPQQPQYGTIPALQQQQNVLSYQQQAALQGYGGIYPTIDQMAAGRPSQPMLPQGGHSYPQQQPQGPYLQPKVGRLPADRPLVKLSVSLIDTYKDINTLYYEERDARRAARAKEKAKKASQQTPSVPGQGANNNGWDDENYDYIINPGELFYGRYKIKERIGKGSFGQVVRAEDTEQNCDVAIKIIKSKKPFLMQAKTEIELLTHLNDKDGGDQYNVGKYAQSEKAIRCSFVLQIRHSLDRLLSFINSSVADAFHVSQSPMSCIRNAFLEFV